MTNKDQKQPQWLPDVEESNYPEDTGVGVKLAAGRFVNQTNVINMTPTQTVPSADN